jgi:MFS family permease
MASKTELTPLGLATILVGAFLPIADFFIVNVALPTISSDLHASSATLELVVAGYGIPYALLLVLGGRLGDLYGRRRLFMLGMALFTLCSLLCGIAPTDVALVVFRAAQGASAALMVPQVLATIQASSTGERRARALGLYGATAGVGAVVGQLAGGAIVALDLAGTSWRPIFLVNVPIGLVGLALAWRNVPTSHAENPPRIDATGTALLGAAVLALLLPLTEGRSLGWPAWSWILLALAAPAAVAFSVVEGRLERAGRHPIVPPTLLRLRGMRRGLGITLPFFAGFGAFMFVSAIALQDDAGFSALRSGVALAPLAAAFLFASLTTARLTARHGSRILSVGAVLQAVGLLALAVTLLLQWPGVSPLTLAPAMLVIGLGQGLVVSPLFSFVLAGVPAERAGVGGGIVTTTLQVALALGVATIGSLFLSLSHPASLGVRDSFVAVLVLQTVVAIAVALTGWTLTRPAAAEAPAPALEPVFEQAA